MVEVVLAGFNVDAEVVESVQEGKDVSSEQLSPESVPASYARISRDPRDIPELRRDAREDVKSARRSNRNIIFQMGHKSVGNHANFNFDVMHISRLAVEWLEARRVGAGYTEKSQRYITLDGDYVMPEEFSREDQVKFRDLVENVQNRFYLDNLDALVDYHFEQNPDLAKAAADTEARGVPDKRNRAKNMLEGWGKEDARYALGLAIEAQVGVTFSATALEHAIRNMKYAPLAEVRELAGKLFDVTKGIAPSLILYTDPEIFQRSFRGKELQDGAFREGPEHIRKVVSDTLKDIKLKLSFVNPASFSYQGDDVALVRNNDHDMNILAAVLFSNSQWPIEECYLAAKELKRDGDRALKFMRDVWQYVSEFDNPPREFEHGGPLMFAMTVSSSCYAQLKRHRMMTLTAQDYNPKLSFTCPDSVKAVGLESALKEVVDRSSELYREFLPKYGRAAEYCLTNAHRRRVLVSVNSRELNHLARQRCDSHAQWDIRDKAHKMLALAKDYAPLAHLLSSGKDEFQELKEEIYGLPDDEK